MSDSFIRVDQLIPPERKPRELRYIAAALFLLGLLASTGVYFADTHNVTITVDP